MAGNESVHWYSRTSQGTLCVCPWYCRGHAVYCLLYFIVFTDEIIVLACSSVFCRRWQHHVESFFIAL
jgi:hypothetical protein